MSHNLTDREIFNKISVDVGIHLAGKAHNIKNLNASEQSYWMQIQTMLAKSLRLPARKVWFALCLSAAHRCMEYIILKKL